MTTGDLFANRSPANNARIALGEAALVLRGFTLSEAPDLIVTMGTTTRQAAFRHMVTPGGFEMSVAFINSGALGQASDRRGYRYVTHGPLAGNPQPPLPDVFLRLVHNVAVETGFHGFTPDACLVSRYIPGIRMSLHQDRDEQDYSVPIVSVPLDTPAIFLFGERRCADRPQRIPLFYDDVIVQGGLDRLYCHGTAPLRGHPYTMLGGQCINLTSHETG